MTDWLSTLEKSLQKLLQLDQEGSCGQFDLVSNPHILVQVYDGIAQDSDQLDTLSQFQKRFQSKLIAPIAPDQTKIKISPRALKSITDEEKRLELRAWREYHYLKAQKQHEKDIQSFSKKAERHRRIISTYENSVRGYVEYMGASLGLDRPEDSSNFFFAQPRSLPIRENDRRRHTYLTGGTGTGKSENIKTLVHHYLTKNTRTALVVIDPHGKLAREIAQFKENKSNGRLVYIKPDLKDGIAPTLNPLEVKRKTANAITVQTEEVISVFRELIGGGETSSKFTTQMEVLLYPCIYTLIHMGGRDLSDLLKFMHPDQARPFIQYALKNLDNPSHLNFFEVIYPESTYDPTRLAISTRLQSIFNSHPVSRFLIGPSSFDLEKLVEGKSLIVFDLADLGDMSRETVGRFIVAQLQSYARRRRIGATPIHLFIDEAHQFISPSLGRIMKEARKFGLHVTLAQQIYGEGMSSKMREIISGNTSVKICARNADKSLRAFASNTGTDLEILKDLKEFEYLIQSGDSPSVVYRLPPKTIGRNNSMTRDDWRTILNDQVSRFYRSNEESSSRKSAPIGRQPKTSHPIGKTNPLGRFGRKPPKSPS